MKKYIIIILSLAIIFGGKVGADYNQSLVQNPYFMEDVYSFIETEDNTTNIGLGYCEEVYLKATRRREYTEYEISICGEYFTQKNNEEMAYMYYMLNNRELFY